MRLHILAFGIVKDIFGAPAIDMEIDGYVAAKDLKILLEERFPRLKELGSFMIAADNEYAQQDTIITANNEVAIIPPVSGG